MTHSIDRRSFLTTTAVLGVGLGCEASAAPSAPREFYELRRYRLETTEDRALLLKHIQGALLPALGRAGVARVGVFVGGKADSGPDVHLLLPSTDPALLGGLEERLGADTEFAAAARQWNDRKAAVYTRVESRLLQAFKSIPVIESPGAASTSRLFELRTYESVNADAARRKVAMFDEGETQLMRDVGLAPVFFGAGRIGPDLPSLTYMLAADDAAAHSSHWKAFLAHPEWDRIKVLPQYAGTVSKIHSTFLRSADCSGL